ncbi:MAG: hypothetical protein NXI12_07590 [Alphaproteobacteria bacterium]|nr:hypothetical protein [Alphaproteobacteria bacterium]
MMLSQSIAAASLFLTATSAACSHQTSPGFTPDLDEATALLILLAPEVTLIDEAYQEPAALTLVELIAGRVLGAPPSEDAATLAWAEGGCTLAGEDGVRQTFSCEITLHSVTRTGVDAVGLRSELESVVRLRFTLSGDTRTDASELNWVIDGGVVHALFAG